jgi:hypothetical protein
MPGPHQKNNPAPIGPDSPGAPARTPTDSITYLRDEFHTHGNTTTTRVGPLDLSIYTLSPLLPTTAVDPPTLNGFRFDYQRAAALEAQTRSSAGTVLAAPSAFFANSPEIRSPSTPRFFDVLDIEGFNGYISLDKNQPRGVFEIISGATRTQVGAQRGGMFMTITGAEHFAEFTRLISNGELSVSEFTVQSDGRSFTATPALRSKERAGFTATVGGNVDALFQTYGLKPRYEHSFAKEGRHVEGPFGWMSGNLALNSFKMPEAVTTSVVFNSDRGNQFGLVFSTETDRNVIGFRGLLNMNTGAVSGSVVGIQEQLPNAKVAQGVFGTLAVDTRLDAYRIKLEVGGYGTNSRYPDAVPSASSPPGYEAGVSFMFTFTPDPGARK